LQCTLHIMYVPSPPACTHCMLSFAYILEGVASSQFTPVYGLHCLLSYVYFALLLAAPPPQKWTLPGDFGLRSMPSSLHILKAASFVTTILCIWSAGHTQARPHPPHNINSTREPIWSQQKRLGSTLLGALNGLGTPEVNLSTVTPPPSHPSPLIAQDPYFIPLAPLLH
jgi:hypothetical protein